jgi:hypothetical protein
MVRRKKTVKAGEKMKKVTFADPIATELKAPKPTILDDSIILIKGNLTAQPGSQNFSSCDDVLQVECCTLSYFISPSEKETDKMTAQRKVAEENNWATGGNNMSEQNKNLYPVENTVHADLSYPSCGDIADHVVTVPAEKEAALMIEKEGMQQALTETLKIMQKQLAMPTVIPVSDSSHPSVSIIEKLVPVGKNNNLQAASLDVQVDAVVESEAASLDVQVDAVVESEAQPIHAPPDNTVLVSTIVTEISQSANNLHTHSHRPPEHTSSEVLVQLDSTKVPAQENASNVLEADDVEAFLDSIALPMQQPIIQEACDLVNPSNDPNHPSPTQNSTQRKSTILAEKAPLNVGKDPFQVAHDILVKKTR